MTFDSRVQRRPSSEGSAEGKQAGSKHIFLRLRRNELDKISYEIIYSNLVCKEISRTGNTVSIILNQVPTDVRSSQQGVEVRLEGTAIKLSLQPSSADESVAIIIEY